MGAPPEHPLVQLLEGQRAAVGHAARPLAAELAHLQYPLRTVVARVDRREVRVRSRQPVHVEACAKSAPLPGQRTI
eukprot:5695805-Pyramimonas_sp.AAC.1